MVDLPPELSLSESNARIGTSRVRAVDSTLFVAFNRALQQWEIWGPHYRPALDDRNLPQWSPLDVLTDDRGVLLRPPFDWDAICINLVKRRNQGIRAAERFRAVQSIRDYNSRLAAKKAAARGAQIRDGAEYYHEAVRRESEGDGRWHADDVAAGYHSRWL